MAEAVSDCLSPCLACLEPVLDTRLMEEMTSLAKTYKHKDFTTSAPEDLAHELSIHGRSLPLAHRESQGMTSTKSSSRRSIMQMGQVLFMEILGAPRGALRDSAFMDRSLRRCSEEGTPTSSSPLPVSPFPPSNAETPPSTFSKDIVGSSDELSRLEISSGSAFSMSGQTRKRGSRSLLA